MNVVWGIRWDRDDDRRRRLLLAVGLMAVLAALSMGLYLWLRHPDFRAACRETPLGDAPQ